MNRIYLSVLLLAAASVFAEKTVTPIAPKLVDNCYQIGTVAELFGFAEIVNDENNAAHDNCACGRLTADILVNTQNPENAGGSELISWTPIMNYCGTFDGNGKSITGLSFINWDGGNIGFFGSTIKKFVSLEEEYHATIKDLNLIDAYFSGDTCVGTLIGHGEETDIINVHTDGSAHGRYAIGGFAGYLRTGTITHSFNEAGGDAKAAGGAFIGVVEGNISITNSYNKGHLTPDNDGCCSSSTPKSPIRLVGYNYGTVTVENSYHMPQKTWNNDRASLDGVTVIHSFYDGSYIGKYGTHVTTHEFNDGTVAKLLREYKSDSTGTDGSVWGQEIGKDESPVFTDKFNFYSIIPQTPKIVEGCYQIGTVEELFGFANIVNTSLYNITPFCAQLTKDITLNKDVAAKKKGDIQWIPIRDFDGTFDGQGHTISGIYINDTTLTNAGLFASVFNRDPLFPTIIKDVNIADTYIRGGLNTGTLVGKIDTLSKDVVIENCGVKAVTGNSYIYEAKQFRGGIVGLLHGGTLTIKQTSSEINLFGQGNGGGLVGNVMGSLNIVNSYSILTDADYFQAQGLVGYAPQPYYSGSTPVTAQINIENSYGLTKSATTPDLIYVHLSRVPVPVTYKNVFHIDYSGTSEDSVGFFSATEEQFKNGAVASALHIYKSETADGSVWGQNVGTDEYPKLTGTVSGITAAKVSVSYLKLITFDGDTTKYMDKYVEGVEALLPTAERQGYVFKGWYSNKDYSGTPVRFIPKDAKGDQIYYARWWHIPSVVNNCYEISDAGELLQFADIYNSEKEHESTCVKLTADIVFNEKVLVKGELDKENSLTFVNWTPIKNFIGEFDGQGHSISGLYVNLSSDGVGFFGSVGLKREVGEKAPVTTTVIKDLHIKDSYFYGNKKVGSLIGYSESASNLSVINVTSESYVDGNSNQIGGIIGVYNNDEGPKDIVFNMVNVHHNGITFGYNVVGGIAGSIRYATSNLVNVSKTGGTYGYSGIGGLVAETLGSKESPLYITYAYNEGPIESITSTVAGLVAYIRSDLHITNSYNVGNLNAQTFEAGGLVGQTNGFLTVINSYNKGIASAKRDTLVDGFISQIKDVVEVNLDNAFYPSTSVSANGEANGATAVATTEFTDLSLAKKLHDYNKDGINGEGWGQEAGDDYPHFKADAVEAYTAEFLKNMDIPVSSSSATSSSATVSSSSNAESSSSEISSSSATSSSSEIASSYSNVNSSSSSSSSKAKSSSSSVVKSSSSSSKTVSSSSVKSSSSSSKAKSSSSSVIKSSSSSSKGKSNSSSSKESRLNDVKTPVVLRITVEPSLISIHGATAGSDIALMDMQGRILYRAKAPSTNFNIAKPTPGTYIIQLKKQKQIITIR